MNTSLKWLVTASIVNLAGNTLGTVIAVNRNLAAGFGSVPNGSSVLQDFLGLKGTALSGPLSFMLIPASADHARVATWSHRQDWDRRIDLPGPVLHAGAEWRADCIAAIQPGRF